VEFGLLWIEVDIVAARTRSTNVRSGAEDIPVGLSGTNEVDVWRVQKPAEFILDFFLVLLEVLLPETCECGRQDTSNDGLRSDIPLA
jgi:hypothetical protein